MKQGTNHISIHVWHDTKQDSHDFWNLHMELST